MRARWQWYRVNMAACKETADSTGSSRFFACRLKSRYLADVLSAQKNLIEGSECYAPAEINLQGALGSKIDEDNVLWGTGGGRQPGLPGRVCKLRSPGLVQGVAAPMFSSSSQNQPRVSVGEIPGTSGLQQAEARSPSATQEQPAVVPGRPSQQQRSTRTEEVHQLLAETRRTNDLLAARNVEDIAFHARLLEQQSQTSAEVRSLTAAVRDLTGAVNESGAAMARAAQAARADSVRLTEQVVLAVALIMRILQNQVQPPQ
ncbi:hypothetical protein V5799_001266 [Amblyomma americanum]|uniref:Uncharacterized protein n=1 Tax=Amblyomma americanum TaxID=6943 RepID=A0AAQ4D0P3_AMBAM